MGIGFGVTRTVLPEAEWQDPVRVPRSEDERSTVRACSNTIHRPCEAADGTATVYGRSITASPRTAVVASGVVWVRCCEVRRHRIEDNDAQRLNQEKAVGGRAER